MQMLRFTQHDNSMSVILNNVKDLAPYPRTVGRRRTYGSSRRQ